MFGGARGGSSGCVAVEVVVKVPGLAWRGRMTPFGGESFPVKESVRARLWVPEDCVGFVLWTTLGSERCQEHMKTRGGRIALNTEPPIFSVEYPISTSSFLFSNRATTASSDEHTHLHRRDETEH